MTSERVRAVDERARKRDQKSLPVAIAAFLLAGGLVGWTVYKDVRADNALENARELGHQVDLVCREGGPAAEELGRRCDFARQVQREPGADINAPEPDDPEIQNAERDDPDPNDPERQDAEVQDPERQDPEILNGEVQDPEVQDSEVDDPEVNDPDPDDPETQDPEIDDPDPNDPDPDTPNPPASQRIVINGVAYDCTRDAGSPDNNPSYTCNPA